MADQQQSPSLPLIGKQYNMSPVPAAPWLMTPYGFQQKSFGRYPSLLATPGTPAAQVQERFGLALLLSLFGRGGGDDRNPWNFRPLANFQQQMANPQPFFWPVTTTLG
ncbi:hypothetical protein DAPPUDRAFT_106972 [Daphnia pulex]|uniref:Uncharacterized protein n=1 Tax=Daphnia pulex TaxID=6669 RepID=E9GVJ0_DAPPU|nr:hypothetical protein DAPPUDRAFT_106972 [Daphnia pulex]|eukprot:EFX76522.1 hypothetical protein DAPPUDRAFT_106972 [Daphnia pulex]